MTDKITKKHQLFVDYYLQLMNGTRAYMLVYPKASYETAMANASRLLGTAKVKDLINKRLEESRMSAEDVLRRMEDIARGDVSELMDITSVGFNLDMAKAKRKGLTRLIKKVKQRTITKIGKKDSDDDTETHELEIELYDAQTAQRDLLKIHGKFTDRVDVTSGGVILKIVRNEKTDAD
jgi:phage terminase small subunit